MRKQSKEPHVIAFLTLCMNKEEKAYIRSMNWKEKLKWKLLIILIALIGILIVWCAGKAGERKAVTEKEILREYAQKENEWASAKTELPKESQPQQEAEAPEEAMEEPSIRVVLMTNDYESYYHSEVSLEFQGTYQTEGVIQKTFSSGEKITLKTGCQELANGSLRFLPENQECRIALTSLKRGQGVPSYKGSLEIYEDEYGLHLVNELPLEDYLCGVVPSEMPSAYPKEALKAQAVCARTYACVQLESKKLEQLHGQVDDSVSYQVYQNTAEAESANEAVQETKGEILLKDGNPIQAYYFSTSHGKTSTDEVWETASPASYLKSVDCTYDSQEPWYQWEVLVSKENILKNVQQLLPEVKEVQRVEIVEKGEGDAVLHLKVETEQGAKSFYSEYDIRSVLAPLGAEIIRQDGSSVKGGKLLPSAYFTMEEQTDTAGVWTGYQIKGGGYGHGVGMSQNGAKGMADTGKTYEEILNYFYQEVELGQVQDVVKKENP